MSILLPLLMTPLTIVFGTLIFIDVSTCTVDEKCGLFYAALAAHIEGLRVSERALSVVPRIKASMKRMGGAARGAGSKARRLRAIDEAKTLRPHLAKMTKEGKSASAMAEALIAMAARKPSMRPAKGGLWTGALAPPGVEDAD